MPRLYFALVAVVALAGCAGPRSYFRTTVAPIPNAFSCAARELEAMGYTLDLADSVGGLLQGHREITGLRETARRGAAAATEVITGGLAGGKLSRYDELTVSVYMRRSPYNGNMIEATAGMMTLTDGVREQVAPTDAARRDARRLLEACAGG